MRTEPRATSAHAILESESRFMRWMLAPGTPLVVMSLSAIGFWVFEATLHAWHFDNRSFLKDLVAPDEHELWMRAVVSLVLLLVGVAWRIANTERLARIASLERYQERLQELTLELASADSDERRALARRLHDSVGQQLTAARLFLASVEADQLEDAAPLASARRIVDRTTTEVREIAEELAPRALDEFGLEEALGSLARRIMRRSGVSIDVETRPCGPVAPDSGHVGFQVAAEILEYAVRQNTPDGVRLRCTGRDQEIEVAVCWRGVTAEDFFSQSERMSRVGGALVVKPVEDRTCVTLILPLAAA